MHKVLVVALLIACSLAFFVWWIAEGRAYTWRYRITIDVETPEGVKTGTVVREVSISPSLKLTPEMGPDTKMRGEAVVVDLGQRGILFGLLSADSYYEVFEAFPTSGETTLKGLSFYKNLPVGKSAYIERTIPRLAYFKDMSDPKSAVLVSQRNLAAHLGQGVSLKSVKIEIVNDPVEWNVTKLLPWLPDYYSQRLDGQRFGTIESKHKDANSLSSGAFSAGK